MPTGSIVFLDTNVLFYAASGRPDDAPKTARARRLIQEEQVGISFQVLQEFYANAVNAKKLNLSAAEAARWCAAWMQFPVASLGLEAFVRTLELAQKFHISNWDAAILAAADQLECSVVYSEDLSHGQDYDGVRVENPFRGIAAPPADGT
jgi:predicted nucleic acid-binding protein